MSANSNNSSNRFHRFYNRFYHSLPTYPHFLNFSFLCPGDFLNVTSHACVGGTLVRDDVRLLQQGIQVVVGTPGRVYDMINRQALNLKSMKMFVLDEADEMLSRGFKDQIYDIFQFLPEKVQVCLFSATMPSEILDISEKFMRDPIRILVQKDELTLEGLFSYFGKAFSRS